MLEFGDKPDIRFRLDEKQIGLEHTRIDPQEYRRGAKLADAQFPERCFSTTGLHYERELRRDNDDLVETMFNFGEWEEVGIAMERWAKSCASALMTKTKKMNHPEFDRFDENWLLVTGEIGPDNDQVSWNIAPRYLFEAIKQAGFCADAASGEAQFHRVYFSFDPHLFLHTTQKLVRLAPFPETTPQ